MSSRTVNKMRGHQALRNINHFIGGHNLFQSKRTYLLNKGEKTPFRKIVILAKLLLCQMSSSTVNNMIGHQTLRNINHFIGGHNLFQTKRTYLLNKGEKTPFRKLVILAKLLLCQMSSSTVNNMIGHQTLRNINHFIGGHNLFQTKRTYLLNKGEKTPFRKLVILAKLLLCQMSSSTVNNMIGHQTLRNINHFIGGHNLFQTKRTYLLNKGEKTPFRKIVILAKLPPISFDRNNIFF